MAFALDWEASPPPLVVWSILTAAFFAVYTCILYPVASRMQTGILRHIRPDDSLLNIGRASWTNIGVVAALGLTIAAAMLQADPFDLSFDPGKPKAQAYAYCSWMSYGLFLTAVVQSSIALIYTDLLSESQMKRLLSTGSNLTRPLLVFIFAFMYAGLGLALHLWEVYGNVAGVFVFALFPTTYYGIFSWWREFDAVQEEEEGHFEELRSLTPRTPRR
jgi:hypothetical protein